MNSRIHRAFAGAVEAGRARQAAERIYVKLQTLGTRQVRLHHGMLLSYPYPTRSGYGTRGILVGIYSVSTHIECIEEDIRRAFNGTSEPRARLEALRIYMKLQTLGIRQVWFHRGRFLTYSYPGKSWFKAHGMLVGIYTLATRLEWIEEDVAQLLSGDNHA